MTARGRRAPSCCCRACRRRPRRSVADRGQRLAHLVVVFAVEKVDHGAIVRPSPRRTVALRYASGSSLARSHTRSDDGRRTLVLVIRARAERPSSSRSRTSRRPSLKNMRRHHARAGRAARGRPSTRPTSPSASRCPTSPAALPACRSTPPGPARPEAFGRRPRLEASAPRDDWRTARVGTRCCSLWARVTADGPPAGCESGDFSGERSRSPITSTVSHYRTGWVHIAIKGLVKSRVNAGRFAIDLRELLTSQRSVHGGGRGTSGGSGTPARATAAAGPAPASRTSYIASWSCPAEGCTTARRHQPVLRPQLVDARDARPACSVRGAYGPR